ncbi:uncharacterized protein LOC110834917 [Zootermopsis nevadensis]|uniref:MARVEL domain-containing protein n=1 Tax=Zootermopsis nevadensis TaxID=136037 RepID=A0A067QXA8_ZOONE|nr:uncharacterized protein LOC110834917 [Zootermopsis nevadensis]KDR14018.1 hypothetical protein L798_11677 [Zootermopsis nevadensis]
MMSHSVTISRTTTTTTSTAIILNTGYLKTGAGLLKLAEMILGCVCVGLVAAYVNNNSYRVNPIYFTQVLFFLLIATAFLITTTCLLLSSLLSFLTASMIHKTLFEVIYHVVAFALYLAAGIVLLVEIKDHDRSQYYNAYLAAAIIGLVNAALYLLSTILAIRTYKGAGL